MSSFNWKTALLVGCGFFGINILWPIYASFVPIFLQVGNADYSRQLLEAGREIPNVAGFALAPGLAFFIMTWDNLVNIFVQPWSGERSDRTSNRFGRRKPWLLAGAPLAALGFALIPLARTIPVFLLCILCANFGLALIRSPLAAWIGDLFPVQQRSKASGVMTMMGGTAAAIAFLMGGVLFGRLGRAAPFLFGALVLLAAIAIVAISVNEPKVTPAPNQGRGVGVVGNLREVWQAPDRAGALFLLAILLWFMAISALEAGASSFGVFGLGMAPARASTFLAFFPLMQIVCAVPAGLAGARLGRRLAMTIGLIGLAVLFPCGFLLVQNEVQFAVLLALMGAGWTFVLVNALPSVFDLGDRRRIGALAGLYFLTTQIAAVVAPILAGQLVQATGNQPRMIFLFGTVAILLALLTLSRVPARVGASRQTATV